MALLLLTLISTLLSEVRSRRAVFANRAGNKVLDVLVGTWETDSAWAFSSALPWGPLKRFAAPNYMVRMLPLKKPDFVTGEVNQSEYFLAETAHSSWSKKGGGSMGSRVIAAVPLISLLPEEEMRENVTVARLEERPDFFHPVTSRGSLRLQRHKGELYWVIEWSYNKRKRRIPERPWLRKVGIASNSSDYDPSKDSTTKKLAAQMFQEWDRSCSIDLEMDDSSPLTFYTNIGPAIGVGLRGGGWAELEVDLCLEPSVEEHRSERLACIIEEMRRSKKNSTSIFGIPNGYESAAKMIEKLLKPGLPRGCLPSICVTFEFEISALPPFIFPIPWLGIDIFWPLPRSEIRECGKVANVTKELELVFAARPADEDAKDAAEHALSSALSLERGDLVQGLSIGIFPPGIGYFVDCDANLALSSRQILQNLWAAKHTIFNFASADRSRCAAMRREFFWSLSVFAQAAHEIYAKKHDNKCRLVRTRLESLKNQVPHLDLENNPLDFAKHLRQLSEPRYEVAAMKDVYLGGGYMYIGLDGFILGYYQDPGELFSPGPARYRNDCEPFEKMVDVYQSRVTHAQHALLTDETCSLGPELPPLGHNSCENVAEASDFPGLPRYPRVEVNQYGEVVSATDSQCSRCAGVTSFGFPCDYCSTLIGNPTCRQYSTTHVCQIGGLVRAKVEDFDHPRDPRLVCAEHGGKVVRIQAPFRSLKF